MSCIIFLSQVFALVESIIGELLSCELRAWFGVKIPSWDLDFFIPSCFPFVLFQFASGLFFV